MFLRDIALNSIVMENVRNNQSADICTNALPVRAPTRIQNVEKEPRSENKTEIVSIPRILSFYDKPLSDINIPLFHAISKGL